MTVFKDLNEEKQTGRTSGAYSPFENVIILDDKSFEELCEKGDLASLLIIIFHEGTHCYQYMEDPLDVNEITNEKFDEKQIELILSMFAPNFDKRMKEPTYERDVRYAAHLSYLEVPKEKKQELWHIKMQ